MATTEFLSRPIAERPVRYAPRFLYVEPISACNLKCKMCYTNVVNGAASQTMAAATLMPVIDRFIAEAATHGDPSDPIEIYWCGTGEVFLHREFPSMVNQIATEHANVNQQIQTNGTVHRLGEISSLVGLTFFISIDGSREFHEWHRGANTYDRTLDFARKARDGGASIVIRMLPTSANFQNLDEFHAELVARIGADIQLDFTPPFTNDKLSVARKGSLSIVQHDIVEGGALTSQEIVRLLKEKYEGRYELNRGGDAQNYVSILPYGVFSCCHGIIKLGDMGTGLPQIRERMAATVDQCRACSLYPCS